ncbi:transglutaminase-like domain-containing protein [Aegicerativicinus sediminis]|uniref:transglutaminase-like domain-containing protein n=1 Tax=Aegicerativicinus sediminis TaxID=2893202 RepID=UPI001E3A3D8A|nr:transglutaminase family protein [Aegicerativicinus sediminis]
MVYNYTIRYQSKNTYENPVSEATWQFLVTPEDNETQEVVSAHFFTSVNARIEDSINGYGFKTNRIYCKTPFDEIKFTAIIKVYKHKVNPFDFNLNLSNLEDYEKIDDISFKVLYEPFLKSTRLTYLKMDPTSLFNFDRDNTIFDNLVALNIWVYKFIKFQSGVTNVDSNLDEILKIKKGVCQDFSHLFCALARANGIPTRYVSGYLHQGEGFMGDSVMHAWVESFIPSLGWVGFDPTNQLMVNEHHIKVAHGKDYKDCPPIKGVVYSTGKNYTEYSVAVSHDFEAQLHEQQQQQQQ